MNFAELAAAAGLFLVTVIGLGVSRDRFPVSDFRLVGDDVEVETLLEPVADHVQMQLADAGDDQFVRLCVPAHAERRIFVGDLVQARRNLLLVATGLGFHGESEHRLGEPRQRQLLGRRAGSQRVADVQIFDFGEGDDIAGHGFRDRVELLALHDLQAAERQRLARAQIDDLLLADSLPPIDADEAEIADEFVGQRLEHLADELAVVVGRRRDPSCRRREAALPAPACSWSRPRAIRVRRHPFSRRCKKSARSNPWQSLSAKPT